MKTVGRVVIMAISAVVLFFLFSHTFPSIKSWRTWNLPLSGKVIVLDAGHGGIDGGAERNGVMEKDITLTIAKKTRDYLQEQGAIVILTREDDYDLAANGTESIARRKVEDLQARVRKVNEVGADFFVSIHLNSFPSASSKGAQTFYYGSLMENEEAAKFIQDEMRKNLNNTNRIAKQIQHVYLMKHAKVPGVLVEAGFLSNTEERGLLATEKYQNKIAESLYRGILRYYTDEGKAPN